MFQNPNFRFDSIRLIETESNRIEYFDNRLITRLYILMMGGAVSWVRGARLAGNLVEAPGVDLCSIVGSLSVGSLTVLNLNDVRLLYISLWNPTTEHRELARCRDVDNR